MQRAILANPQDVTVPLIDKPDKIPMPSLASSVAQVWTLSLWILLYALLHPIYFLISSIAASRLGTDQLAGFGLGSLTIGIIGISISLAFNGGVLTLASAAAGQKDFRACIVYRNRTIFLDMMIFILLGIPMLMIDEIFVFLGQEKRVAFYAATYVKIVYPSIIFLYIF
jgi:Na+-driven multidrug efflux pump